MTMDYDDFDYCGTLDLYALDDAVEAYKAGEPIPEGITIDEVEMTVLDDWENVGSMSDENGPVDLYAPWVCGLVQDDPDLGVDEFT